MFKNFEQGPEGQKDNNNVEAESIPKLTDEQIETIVNRVVDVLSERERAATSQVPQTGGDADRRLREKVSQMDASRDDEFYRRLDGIILDKINRITHAEGQDRLDDKVTEAYRQTEEYRKGLSQK